MITEYGIILTVMDDGKLGTSIVNTYIPVPVYDGDRVTAANKLKDFTDKNGLCVFGSKEFLLNNAFDLCETDFTRALM